MTSVTLEQLPAPETDHTSAEKHLGQLSLLHELARQEVIERGDRLGDGPDRGFRIELLDGERSHEPVPVGVALPDMSKRFAQEYVGDKLSITEVEDAWSGVTRGLPGFVVYFPVDASNYKAAVAEGKASDGLFGTDNKVMSIVPGAKVLDTLVDLEKKRAAVEAYYQKQPHAVNRQYVDDLDGITYADRSNAREELEQVSEAYDLVDGGRTMRLINLSTTKLTEEQLRQATNAIRAISDKSGGELFDRLDTIAIVPEEYRSMQQDVKMPDGRVEMVPINGYQSPRLLALSDRLLKPSEQKKPLPDGLGDFFEQHRLPGEPTEGPGSPRKKVSEENWELTLSHELTHIALPKEIQQTSTLSGPAPTLYGRYNRYEHIAELGAAEFAGGDSVLEVPDQQRREFEQMWQRQRGSEDGIEYKQPVGPRFVVCRELDITKPLPLRTKRPDSPLPVEVTYRLNVDG